MHEVLKKSPHAHIVKYYGCVVKGNEVVGLAMEEHEEDLAIRCQHQDRPLDMNQVVCDVQLALDHLHGLDYCHDDVNPQNIVVTEDDSALLIDFDACLRKGLALCKWPLAESKRKDSTISFQDNDQYGLNKTEEFMREAFNKVANWIVKNAPATVCGVNE